MNTKNILIATSLLMSFSSFASDYTEYDLSFGSNGNGDGSIEINLDQALSHTVNKSFFGADTNGFSTLPDSSVVTPLQLGHVKFGGNLHSTFNWELNAYFDHGINYVYSPVERRLKLVGQNYHSSPMFQVNMLGWQPDKDANGKLVFAHTANAQHAANAITYLNGKMKIGLEDIIMGNEPFDSMDVHHVAIPSADEYIDNYIQYAMAIRKSQEKISGNSNDVKLWGPELANGWSNWQSTHPNDCIEDGSLPEKFKCSYGNGKFSEFMPYFLYRISEFEKDKVRNPKHYKMLDYITWHYYPLFRTNFKDNTSIILNENGKQNVTGMLESVNIWDNENYINKYDYASPRGIAPNLIKRFQDWRSTYYPSAKIACTEFGIDSIANISYDPIVRPLYLADLIGRLGRSGVDSFVYSFLQSGNEANSWALINGSERSVLYKLYSLFSNNYLGRVVSSTDNFNDALNSYSIKTENGINVFIVNKDNVEHTSKLNVLKDGAIEELTSVKLPYYSLTILKIPNNRAQRIKVIQYGAKEMGIALD